MTLYVPDYSEWQSNVNWAAVKRANGGAAIVRAHNGYRVDHLWSGGRRASAERAGITALGFYQYVVSSRSALTQAEEFVSCVGHLKPGQFAVMDLEAGGGNQLARARQWLNYVDAHLTYSGYHGAWLYSGDAFFHERGLMPIANSSRHTWVARYSSHAPTAPHTLWQYTDNRAVGKGTPSDDLSKFGGTLSQFLVKVHSGSTPTPPKPKPAPPGGEPKAHLAVDGSFGPATKLALKKALVYRGHSTGVTTTGTYAHDFGIPSVKALQAYLKVHVDGSFGPATTKALQKHVHATPDGVMGSRTVKALQVQLNAGSF